MYIFIDLDNKKKLCKKLIFSYLLVSTYVFGVQKNQLIEKVLLSTHNIFLVEK